jgi:hypothetical protein
MAVHRKALPLKRSSQSSHTIKTDHSSPLNDAGGCVQRVVGGLGDGWRAADKLRANNQRGYKLKSEKGVSRWLQTSNLTSTRQLSLEGSVEKDWSNGMGVGKVRGGHQSKSVRP